MRDVDNTCGHRSHMYWDWRGEDGVRMGTHDRSSTHMRYKPCPEPFTRAFDEPPIGTVVEAPCGKRFRRYERGWGGVTLTRTLPNGETSTEQPGGSWRPMWEAWGDLTIVDVDDETE